MANGFLISGWLLRVLDANGDPPGSAFPFQVAFFDASTQTPATVFNDVDCSVELGPVVALDADGYAPDGGVWGEVGKSYKAVVSRVLSTDMELPDSERLETLYTLNGIGESAESSASSGSGVSVPDVEALRSVQPSVGGGLFYLAGYRSAGDGGQGWMRWDADSMETDDGGYCFRPFAVSAALPGRYIRCIGEGELDVRWWGAIPDGVEDCVSALAACRSHAGRIDLYGGVPRIVFPAGPAYYRLPGAVVLGGVNGRGQSYCWRVRAGARFGGFSLLRFESDTVFENTSPLVWTDSDTGTWSSQPEVLPSACRVVDVRWWAHDEADGVFDGRVLGWVRAPGCSVLLPSGAFAGDVVEFPAPMSVEAHLLVGEGVTLRAAAEVQLRSVEVVGRKRRVFLRSGSGRFTFSEVGEYPAWMFGWGSGGGDEGLSFAEACVGNSAAGTVFVVNGYGVDGYAAPVLTSEVNSYLPARIDGRLKIGVAGRFGCMSLDNAPRSWIFEAPGSAPVYIWGGVAHASWFGTSGRSFRQAMASVAYSQSTSYARSVDLDGLDYAVAAADSVIVDYDRLTLRGGSLSADSGTYNLLDVRGSSFSCEDVRFYAASGFAGALLALDTYADNARAKARSGFSVRRCSFDLGNSGTGLRVGGNRADKATERVSVEECVFSTRAAGSFPFAIPNDAARSVRFGECSFLGLYRQEWVFYGTGVSFVECEWTTASAAAAIFRWKGASGLRFVRNRADKLGVVIETYTLSDIVVSDNRFTTQGVVFIGCMANGQRFEGVLVERNVFELSSIGEWPFAVYLNQEFTVNPGTSAITAVTRRFDWVPENLKLRIADNAANMGQVHQTEVTGVKVDSGYGFLRGLIPLANVVSLSFFPSNARVVGTSFGPGTYPNVRYADSTGGSLYCEFLQATAWSAKLSKYGNNRNL